MTDQPWWQVPFLNAASSSAPAPTPSDSTAALFASLGIDPSSFGAPAATKALWGNTLATALAATSGAITGRLGQTGHNLSVALPPWAQGLPSAITSSPDYDPFLGVVSQSGDERVFMGGTKEYKHGTTTTTPTGAPTPSGDGVDFMHGGTAVTSQGATGPNTLTVTQALNMPYTWDEKEVAAAIKKFKDAGITIDSFDGGSTSLVAAWGQMVNRAAMTYSLSEGKKEVTPWDVLDLYKKESAAAGTSGTRTSTSRNVTDISEGEAWATLQNNLSNLLGRDPSDQETRDFVYRMNQLAASNPSISKTVETYKGVGTGDASYSSSTHTDPGFTAADMTQQAYDQAQNNPDYAEYRAASTYYNAALSALGPIGG